MDNQTFYIGVKGVVVRDGKVLVLKRINSKGQERFDMPGGRMQPNESFKQTLQRELQEELPGITNIQIGNMVGIRKTKYMFPEGRGLALVSYEVTADLPDPVQLSDEHIGYHWLSKDEVVALNVIPDDDFSIDPLLATLT